MNDEDCLCSSDCALPRVRKQRSGPAGGTAERHARSALADTRADTVWFGGYNEAEGIAYNSVDDGYDTAVWTWDAGTADTLEGWTSIDFTQDPKVYFAWVTADSFCAGSPWPEDPGTDANYIFPPVDTNGQIWVGVHEAEADEMSWELGLGYGNDMCQQAYSPQYNIAAGQNVTIQFKYFQDSEIDFDYTYIHILTYDAAGTLLDPYYPHQVDLLDGKIGTAAAPAIFGPRTVQYSSLPTGTAKVRLLFRFDSDGGWSDEDGEYSCDYGPFAADDVIFRIGTAPADTFDFESGPQGWTFEKCGGVGAFMNIIGEAAWQQLVLGPPAVRCPCDLSGNVLYCATDIVTSPRPGHYVEQDELMVSPIVDREGFTGANGYYDVVVRWDAFNFLRVAAGTRWRPGFRYFPYTTAANPTPRWSPRLGQGTWLYTGQIPLCQHNVLVNLTVPPDGNPLPYGWEQMKYVFEVLTDCDAFGISPDFCKKEGQTNGAPIYDNVRVGITGGVNAPGIVLEEGHIFHDGFGQGLPQFLDPGDVCDANVAYDISRDNTDNNDWCADTAVVHGPPVVWPEQTYWIDLCFKVAKKGPRQDWIPGYSAWKARLPGDPEAGFVCALVDTAMVLSGGHLVPVDGGQARVTYFHEDDPGFDDAYPDQTSEQEILPDRVFTPGTRIEYYYRSYWAQNPSGYFTLPPGAPDQSYEMEFLPMMEADLQTPNEYDVIWPSVLYVDAFNAGAEERIVPMLEQAGVAFDKYDRLEYASRQDAPMLRSYGRDFFNPGGWGNNGCTLEQLLGYRLILWNTGSYGIGAGESQDFVLLQNWLTSTQCGLPDMRRGLILNGDELAEIMGDPTVGRAIPFCNNMLGVTFTGHAYRDYNNDEFGCVWLSPTDGNEFDPAAQISVYGNDCPTIYDYNVIGTAPGVGSIGNLKYVPGSGGTTPIYPEVNFAQVVRESLSGPEGVGGWKSVVDGFSWHHLSEVNYGGEECSKDSLAILEGMLDLVAPELAWLADGGAMPFGKWRYPCEDSEVGDDAEIHLSGPVDFLYPSRPNPFRGTATVRFSLAKEGRVEIAIYDVTGRLVRTLHDGKAPAGESTMIWDGTDDAGHRMGSGVFWVEMNAGGYQSTKRLVTLN
jgi:hypothetical protein